MINRFNSIINKPIFILVVIGCLIRLIFTVVNNQDLSFNPDEEFNYQVALNYTKGLGYVYKIGYGILFDHTKSLHPTAFHPAFPNFVYQFLIVNNISQACWVVFILSLSYVLFLLSIFYFAKILSLLQVPKYIYNLAILLYVFYPSTLYFIGTLFTYENLTLPLLVINFYYFLEILKKKDKFDFNVRSVLIIVSICLSCLLRPQMLVIYFSVLALLFFKIVINYKRQLSSFLLFIAGLTLIIFISHIPVLKRGEIVFGKPLLSSQTGFELLQGHNPYARGSWNGSWHQPNNPLFNYVKNGAEAKGNLNELEESAVRKKLAINFIKENPIKELELIVRKVAIYFLPQNYEVLPTSNWYNPINAILHFSFIFSFVYLLLKFKFLKPDQLLLLSPIIGSLLLSVIFFVGYRWRYYSEPFMILFVSVILDQFWKNKKSLNRVGEKVMIK